jgi:hypothetical protein
MWGSCAGEKAAGDLQQPPKITGSLGLTYNGFSWVEVQYARDFLFFGESFLAHSLVKRAALRQ